MSADEELTTMQRRIVARIVALPDPEPTMSRGRALVRIERRVAALRAARRRRAVALTGLGVLLVGGAAAMTSSSLRRWVGSYVGVRSAADTVFAARPRTIRNAVSLGGRVFFAPIGDEVRLRFDAPQRVGWLTIAVARIPENELAALGGSGQEIVATPAALHVRNDSTSTRSYLLIVASAVHTVRLRIGATEHVIAVDSAATMRVPLSR